MRDKSCDMYGHTNWIVGLLIAFSFFLLQAYAEGVDKKDWTGKSCCHLPQSESCKKTCLQAKSIRDLMTTCRRSDEISFYYCLEVNDVKERRKKCCDTASSKNCTEACKKVFVSSSSPPTEARDAVNRYCLDDGKVSQCVQEYIYLIEGINVPNLNIHCCDASNNTDCKTSCKEILRNGNTTREIMDHLAQVCGLVRPEIHSNNIGKIKDRMWQCFLRSFMAEKEPQGSLISSENIGKPILIQYKNISLAFDSGKLQCCFKAASVNCHRFCLETFSDEFSDSWKDLERLCMHQLEEYEMVRCLTEVDEPCELGCEGLNYCTNFNHRPTEFFRSCSKESDKAAEMNIHEWETKGVIYLPMTEIPVMKSSECQLEDWKALTCALQIKPCNRGPHINSICKSDCINILNKCVDYSRLDGKDPIKLCEILPSPGNTSCISVTPYLVQSQHNETASEVTHPCRPYPCNEIKDELCMVERNCLFGKPCKPYTCVKGCKMGGASNLIVPRNSYVRIPSNKHVITRHGPRCHMVCYCNHDGVLEDCVIQECLHSDPCWYDGKRYSHNTLFKSGCKTCFCFNSEVTCSPKQCSGLPCNCEDRYTPVCGANGKTYPSACLARCAGLTDDQFEFGACYESDPCSPNSCGANQRCLPKRRVCLSIKYMRCKQYECVNRAQSCNELPKYPVCDTDNVEHSNSCWMLRRRKTLAYYGRCMPHCRTRGFVCGHDGETYESKCAAWAERVSVDYKGSCAAVGINYGENSRCDGIKCAPPPSEHCTKVVPPGSCCPICGAALRLLYSQQLSDWSVEHISDIHPVVVRTVAEKLREHVKIRECEVFAYLSLESDIIVLVTAITDSPTKLQVEACVREAEKLQAQFQQQSPILFTELPLSFFTTVIMIDPMPDNAIHLSINLCLVILCTIISVLSKRRM